MRGQEFAIDLLLTLFLFIAAIVVAAKCNQKISGTDVNRCANTNKPQASSVRRASCCFFAVAR